MHTLVCLFLMCLLTNGVCVCVFYGGIQCLSVKHLMLTTGISVFVGDKTSDRTEREYVGVM